jgi:hypothetical protein
MSRPLREWLLLGVLSAAFLLVGAVTFGLIT